MLELYSHKWEPLLREVERMRQNPEGKRKSLGGDGLI